jgi:hypothetical protein
MVTCVDGHQACKVKYSGTPVLRIRIRDPVLFDPCIRDSDSGSGTWKKAGSGIRDRKKLDPVPVWKKPGSESRINIPDHFSESLETVFWVKNTLILCYGSGIFLTLDPGSGKNIPEPSSGMEKFGSGINIPDSATMRNTNLQYC